MPTTATYQGNGEQTRGIRTCYIYIFIARLTTIKKKLDEKYQGECYIIDQLLTAVDIPEIKDTPKEIIPRTYQHAVNRISHRLR